MKMTRHNGRSGKNGTYNPKHNDRRFNLENSEHIDAERAKQNIYWDIFNGYRSFADMDKETELADTFEDVEELYYSHFYRDYVEGQNGRNEKNRHPERNRSADDIRKNKKTCPEESLFQLGTMDDHAPPEVLLQVAVEFMTTFDERFGSHIHILDWALHLDESTPHIHERHVFDCENRYGELCPQQEKALEALGFDLPEPDKKPGRYNNRKMVFDSACRALMFDIAKKHGLHLDEEPEYGGRKYLEKQDIKSFLSRQKDTYKVPYAIHPKDYKRQCVFAGTSNTLDFLPLDRTGNRRFLPVMVQSEQAEVHILENEAASRAYIDQMWAEIMVIYRQGNFKLKLSKDTERYLQDHQKEFMPEDTQAMQILNYLDNFKGKIVCSLQLYYEALGHPTYDEPKQYEIRDINSIMNNYAVGWKAFGNPRHFPAPYNRQKGWERIQSADNGDAQNDGFQKVTDKEARQMGMPDEWLKPKNE